MGGGESGGGVGGGESGGGMGGGAPEECDREKVRDQACSEVSPVER